MVPHTVEQPYQCILCEETFTLKGHLEAHILIHTEEQPYKCSECTGTFSSVQQLNTHMLTHIEEGPYQCYVCEKTYKCKQYLNMHMLSHTEVQSYQCYECGKTFSQEENLNMHMSTHTNVNTEGRYKCSTCEKTFARYQHLKQHMFTHTEQHSSFKWSDETTVLLLQGYVQRLESFRKSKIKKSTLWKQIQEEFSAQGYDIPWELIEMKFRNLKKTYFENSNRKNNGKYVNWKFYNIFEDIFDFHTDPTLIELQLSNHLIASDVVETCQKRKRDEDDDNVGPSDVQTSSSTQTSNIHETPSEGPSPESYKKIRKPWAKVLKGKMLNSMEEKVSALNNVFKCLEESLKLQKEQLVIQKERNEVLISILEKLRN